MTVPAEPPWQNVPPTALRDATYWRERTLRALLVSICVMGLVAYVLSVQRLVADGLWTVVVVDTVLYGWIVAVTLWPRTPYWLRAASICSVPYILGVLLTVQVGVPAGGLTWLASGPIIVAVLLGLRASLFALFLNAVILSTLALVIGRGWLVYAPLVAYPDGGFAVFVAAAANALLLSAALALSVGVLLRGLEESHRQLAREVEERGRAEAERRRLEAQLREAHKLEAVGRLASGVAHDFNNLLVPILANAEELRRASFEPPVAHALDDIILSAMRGRDLVQRVLAFSRRAVTTRSAVRVADVLREAAQLLRAGLPAGVEIHFDLVAENAVVLADPVELHQVVMNLGTNAGYAMRAGGGRLTLGIEADEGAGTVTLTIRDTGEGMTPEVRAHVFEPFFTTKPLGEGSGVGLSTVHAIVADLGGSVSLESEPGTGTVVRVTLPMLSAAADPAPADAEPAAIAAAVTGEMNPARPCVLVVDDEPLVLKTSAMVLTRLGYDVITINDPREALAYVRDHIASIDLLLTDKAMPGLDGLALARHARAVRADLPIVVATGYLDDETVSEVRALGHARVITKPYRIEDLAAAAVEALAGPSEGVLS